MNEFIEKFRTPIISFLIGVLFSSATFFFYFRREGREGLDSEITINHAEASIEDISDDSLVSVCISGALNNPGIFVIDKSKNDWLEVLSNQLDFNETYQEGAIENVNFDSDYVYLPSAQVASEVVPVLGESCININTASKDSLMSLPGIGESYSTRIIESRPFFSLSDIKRVKGIGDKTYEKISDKICL